MLGGEPLFPRLFLVVKAGRGEGEEGGGREGGEGGRVGRFKGGERVGEGEGALFLLPWGEGGGQGSWGGGERHLFLKLREVWEEAFSVPSPFFLLHGCLLGVNQTLKHKPLGCRGEGTCHLSLVLSLVLPLFFLSGSCFTTTQ